MDVLQLFVGAVEGLGLQPGWRLLGERHHAHILPAGIALGDDGASQRMISTVHGRGFRFLRPVVNVAPAPAEKLDMVAALR
jgi:hypothetical protein